MIVLQVSFAPLYEIVFILTFRSEQVENSYFFWLFLFSLLPLFFWVIIKKKNSRKRKERLWLRHNNNLINELNDFIELLNKFGSLTSCCKKCGNDEMQLWNYKDQDLLVIRCSYCKRNYTYSNENNTMTRSILERIENAVRFIKIMVKYRNQSFGKYLGNKTKIKFDDGTGNKNPIQGIYFRALKGESPINDSSLMDISVFEFEIINPKVEKVQVA